MKVRPFSEVALNVYLNCWYVPLFAFLLGIKLCLVSMLVDTIQKGEHNRYEDIVGDEMLRLATSMKSKSYLRKSHHNYGSSSTTSSTTTVSPEIRQGWRILADLENSVVEPTARNRTDPNSIWVIYNRIPRCGGESMVQLLHKLGAENGFTHQEHEYRTPWPRFLLEQEQENLVTWFEYQHLPKSYDRHFFFVNFTSYQKYVMERPIYVNIIRDPALRLKSFYQSKRAIPEIAKLEIERRNEIQQGAGLDWYQQTFETCVQRGELECNYETGSQDFTLMVPFFCGQHPSCVVINDKWALQRAKFTIEKYYSVVGLLEQWNDTLTVLEKFIPKFFGGSTQLYYKTVPKSQKLHRGESSIITASTTVEVPSTIRKLLERKLYGEFELYRFVAQRLKYQLAVVN